MACGSTSLAKNQPPADMPGADDHFRAFREELAAQGFFKRTTVRSLLELAAFVVVTAGGVALLLATQSTLLEAAAMWMVALASLGVSTRAHTASHNAISNRAWVNKALTYFGFPFFLQVSATYWRNKHLVIHHPHPNVAGVDRDADLTPLFALNQYDVERATAWQRMRYKYQVIYLPFLLAGNAVGVVRSGWVFLISRLIDGNARRPEHWIDLGALLLHYVVWIGLPLLYLPAIDVLTFTAIRFVLVGYGMFAFFAPAHYPAEAVVVRAGDCADVVALQTLTTVNYRAGWLGRLIGDGLEYQIEHHLLPSISPAHYPRLSGKVREYCARHGYPYRTLGWGEAIWKSFVTFTRPKPVYALAPGGKEESVPQEPGPQCRSLGRRPASSSLAQAKHEAEVVEDVSREAFPVVSMAHRTNPRPEFARSDIAGE